MSFKALGMARQSGQSLRIAVVGTGISGMSAAWLLSQRHEVTIYDRAPRMGGHSNTVIVSEGGRDIPVDTGFIVYNEATYPNLIALFDYLGVSTVPTEMSFSVSLQNGSFEYSGGHFAGLFAQRTNIFRPRFWSMLNDLKRFYRHARRDLPKLDEITTLGRYLDARRYGRPFREDHLMPMASAIWSAPSTEILNYPAAAFIRFHDNHGLLQIVGRPAWRTVVGGSRSYVDLLCRKLQSCIRLDTGVEAIHRHEGCVELRDSHGNSDRFDHVVIATHADQALAILDTPSDAERRLLGAFRYSRNTAVLHSDAALMPKRRRAWASWNYLDGPSGGGTRVTYWMNRLQHFESRYPIFVTLNPPRPPRLETVQYHEVYEHPVFDVAALTAQRALWSLQGKQRTWFCGAYFGAGFHEDGLQAGLAVAETLGGLQRPWKVDGESGRIFLLTDGADLWKEGVAA
jgi:predicted NAD/FAD-binding protein